MSKRRCCRCPGSTTSTPSPPDSPRTLGPPVVRTSINRHPYDTIASQVANPLYADYYEDIARKSRTRQALNLIGQRIQQPGNSPVYIPPDVLDTIGHYANSRGGKKTRKYKKRPNKKKKRTNRRKSNKKKTNRHK
jgi:hypothetical protein